MSDLTTTFTNIANAIRSKTGSSDTMTPSEMPDEIAGIETPMDSINITRNGTYEPSEGRGYNQVIVEVPEPTLITKSITANGTYSASDDNADGYSSVTVAVEGFKKKSIANTPTDIASFNDGTANPMPSLEISIEPVQSGSGDPSPSNVRPISGWSGANVTRCGKNLFDYTGITKISIGTTTRNGSIFKKSGTYRISAVNGGGYMYARVFNADNTIKTTYYIIATSTIIPITVTINNGEYFALYDANDDDIDTAKGMFANWKAQVELNNVSTAYESYQGSTTTIPFHDNSDNPITVYGGTLNVTSGELTVDRAMVDLGTLTWNYYLSRMYARINNIMVGTTKILCSNYKTSQEHSFTVPDGCITAQNGDNAIIIYDSNYTNKDAFKTAMNGVQLVYELATPQTYQLTPTQVSTLLGQNNIFADCGQILDGEYFVTL